MWFSSPHVPVSVTGERVLSPVMGRCLVTEPAGEQAVLDQQRAEWLHEVTWRWEAVQWRLHRAFFNATRIDCARPVMGFRFDLPARTFCHPVPLTVKREIRYPIYTLSDDSVVSIPVSLRAQATIARVCADFDAAQQWLAAEVERW